MDEKVVVGSYRGNYVEVFSRQGVYERTIRCNICTNFGWNVATLGNLIVTSGFQNSWKLFIYSTEDGQLLKTLDQGSDRISDVAMSEKYIVSTARHGKTFIYSNTSPDFHEIAEINQRGLKVAVMSERLVIGDSSYGCGQDGAAYLYRTDGTLVKTLDRQDAPSGSQFGWSVAITDDKVFVGARIYSAATGEFSVCASDSHYVVGAVGADDNAGAAYLFQSSE